jgi:hypothetical protein
MKARPSWVVVGAVMVVATASSSCRSKPEGVETDPAARTQAFPHGSFQEKIEDNAEKLFKDGRELFRMETFGSEAFWGDQLRLHAAIAGESFGGVGPGLTPRQALQLGLKGDVAKVPGIVAEAVKAGASSLDDPETTLVLLRADAVVGVKGFFDREHRLVSVGITCALCHSTVDDSFVKGIGRRLDGWPNRDLDVGTIVTLAPDLRPFEQALGADRAKVEAVLKAWGPGRYDAELIQDGKGFRPDGRTGATLIPAAFGLAGQNLHTYTGWGSVPYWNAYVANTQMHGKGTFFDPRLANAQQFPVTAKTGFADKRDREDHVTAKLPALHYYQLSIPAPRPPRDSYDEEAARRGFDVFRGAAKCATCHVPPLYSEPGWPMHAPEEIGIDSFQSDRSPDKRYRTTPLAGLFARSKGGFYHDGRFPDLASVVAHYEQVLQLNLAPRQRADLIEFLKSL